MKPRDAGVYETIGRLLRYPGDGCLEDLSSIPERLERQAPEAGRSLALFREQVGGLTLVELQELYTRTFDLNPVCALEVGWQLYGEEYARGSFLVFMRDALRRHGIPECGELPDHLVHVLALMDRLSGSEAREFAADVVLPAVEKMLAALAKKNSPYENLMRALQTLLQASLTTQATEVAHA